MGSVEAAFKASQMGSQYGTPPRVPSRWLEIKGPDHLGSPDEAVPTLGRPKKCLPNTEELSPRPGLIPDTPSTFSRPSLDKNPSDPEALLSKVLENIRSVKPLDPMDVARFLETWDLQPTDIQRLSVHNQRKPVQFRGHWILGEMLYYARRKEWRELIGAFDTYFFRVGIPTNIDEYKSLGRVTVSASSLHKRLFPSAYHTSLVWKAVAEILRGGRPLSMLFEELVEQVTASKTRECARAGPSPAPAPIKMFDAHHFFPFLVAAYQGRKYTHVVAAFGEMSRLGFEPCPEHLGLLAGAHAAMANGREVVRILDRMDAILGEEGTPRSRPTFRDVGLYLPALRRFMERRDTHGASLVRRRILKRGYLEGTRSDVDRMLAKLSKVRR